MGKPAPRHRTGGIRLVRRPPRLQGVTTPAGLLASQHFTFAAFPDRWTQWHLWPVHRCLQLRGQPRIFTGFP